MEGIDIFLLNAYNSIGGMVIYTQLTNYSAGVLIYIHPMELLVSWVLISIPPARLRNFCELITI